MKAPYRSAILVTACVLVLLPFWVLVSGRYRLRGSECRYCARRRVQRWTWGFPVEDRVTPSAVTATVDRLAPGHISHTWNMTSLETRGWLGGGINADGWLSGSSMLYLVKRAEAEFGADVARAFLNEYHDILDRGSPGGELGDLSRSLRAQVEMGALVVGPRLPPYPTTRREPREPPHSETGDLIFLGIIASFAAALAGVMWLVARLTGLRRKTEREQPPREKDPPWGWYFYPGGLLLFGGMAASAIVEGRITFAILLGLMTIPYVVLTIRKPPPWRHGGNRSGSDDQSA